MQTTTGGRGHKHLDVNASPKWLLLPCKKKKCSYICVYIYTISSYHLSRLKLFSRGPRNGNRLLVLKVFLILERGKKNDLRRAEPTGTTTRGHVTLVITGPRDQRVKDVKLLAVFTLVDRNAVRSICFASFEEGIRAGRSNFGILPMVMVSLPLTC